MPPGGINFPKRSTGTRTGGNTMRPCGNGAMYRSAQRRCGVRIIISTLWYAWRSAALFGPGDRDMSEVARRVRPGCHFRAIGLNINDDTTNAGLCAEPAVPYATGPRCAGLLYAQSVWVEPLTRRNARPITLVVDSTGLRVHGGRDWMREKHGLPKTVKHGEGTISALPRKVLRSSSHA